MSTQPGPRPAAVISLRPSGRPTQDLRPSLSEMSTREPLWRNVIGDVLRRERLTQARTLKDVSETARISMPYLSEIERGLKEASSEVLAAAAGALGLDLADLLERAHGELVRQRAPQRPLRLTTGDDLSSARSAPVEDPGAATELTSLVEVTSTAEVGSRHTGPIVMLAA